MCLLYSKDNLKPELIITSIIYSFDKEFTFQNIVDKLNDPSIPNYKISKIIDSFIDSGKIVSNGFKFSLVK